MCVCVCVCVFERKRERERRASTNVHTCIRLCKQAEGEGGFPHRGECRENGMRCGGGSRDCKAQNIPMRLLLAGWRRREGVNEERETREGRRRGI